MHTYIYIYIYTYICINKGRGGGVLRLRRGVGRLGMSIVIGMSSVKSCLVVLVCATSTNRMLSLEGGPTWTYSGADGRHILGCMWMLYVAVCGCWMCRHTCSRLLLQQMLDVRTYTRHHRPHAAYCAACQYRRRHIEAELKCREAGGLWRQRLGQLRWLQGGGLSSVGCRLVSSDVAFFYHVPALF